MSGDLEYRYVAVEGRRAAEIERTRSVPPDLENIDSVIIVLVV